MIRVRHYLVELIIIAVGLSSAAMLYQVGRRVDLPFACSPIEASTTLQDGTVAPTGPRLAYIPRLADGIDIIGPPPQVGDRLLTAGGLPIRHWLDASHVATRLEQDQPRPEGPNPENQSAIDLESLQKAAVPVVDRVNERWVRLELGRKGVAKPIETWVRLRGLSWPTVGLALAWFMAEMTLLGLGAWLIWRRRADPAAMLYFALCATSAVAFVGLFDWQGVIAERWLGWLFIGCGALVAPLAVHLLAIVPRPSRFLRGRPQWGLAALYVLPVLGLLAAALCAVQIERYASRPATAAEATVWLTRLARLAIAYLQFSGVLLLLGLGRAAIVFASARSRARRNQARWVLAATFLAAPIALWLVTSARLTPNMLVFATGPRVLLFLAQLVFAAGLAASVLRVRFFFGGRLLNQGLVYVGISLAATGIFCLLVGLGTAVVGRYYLQWENALAAGLTAMTMVAVLGWLRVRLQTSVDRRFLRQKYQLDKALRRLAAAVDRLVEADQLAGQMLQAARDCVGAQRGAVYVRDKIAPRFELSAHIGWQAAPVALSATAPMIAEARVDGVLSSRSAITALPTPGQLQMREFDAELAVPLELEGRAVGLLLLGDKADDSAYSPEDQNFLIALARTTTLALQSAAGHRTIEYLQTRLADHVAKIAEQQRRIVFLQAELLNRGPQRLTGRAPLELSADETPIAGRRGARRQLKVESRAEATSSSPADTQETATLSIGPALFGSSPALKQLVSQAVKVASSPASVLIRGESGTGKELLARTIHAHSPRHAGPFVAVHCAALSAGLLESELFGHVKGAFTGADRDRAGRFELAHAGTLFLDEIGDISLETQIKLLRVLQERAFERVGGVARIDVDVRVIAATHQNLEELIRRGQFREDLFYRLNVISLRCPPLRERSGDLFELAMQFLRQYADQAGKHLTRIDEDALDALTACSWPGNIRQLENAIERAVVLADGDSITRADLPPEVLAASPSADRVTLRPDRSSARRGRARAMAPVAIDEPLPLAAHAATDEPFDVGFDDFERQRLLATLEECGGNKSLAARRLGMPRSTLFSKLSRLGIE